MPSKAEEILSIHELPNRNGAEQQDENAAGKTKGGTATDLHEMQRMGRVQELRVRPYEGGCATGICC